MDAASEIRAARARSRLTQAELAAWAGTSQATISAYESGRKQPSVATLHRLLAATGMRLAVEKSLPPREPSSAELSRAGARLVEVLALAEALPVRHEPTLRFPVLRNLARSG